MEKFKYIKDGKETILTREDLGLSEFEALTLFNYLNDTLNKTPYDWWVRFSVYLALVKEFANRSHIELDKLHVHQNIANAIKRLQLQPDKLTVFDDYDWNEIAKIWNSKNIEF